jgi:ATPase components of ABC transporters with duplicated ATPase domains
MLAISCDNLSLSFGAVKILDRVSFALNEGERLGIIGVNGAGKTSLFRLITGEYKPDLPEPNEPAGGVYIAKGATVGTLTQTLDFAPDATLHSAALDTFKVLLNDEAELEKLRLAVESSHGSDENAAELAARYASLHDRFTRAGGFEFRGRVRGILVNLGFDERFWEMSVSSLSGGQKTRLALACLLLREPDILLLDEPTNHLDTDAMYWLEEYLKSKRKTALVVSHDRYFLDSVATKILEIENTHGKLYNGNYTAAREKKASDREIQEKHYKNQQREIARIEAYIEQQRRWNRERNIIAAESRQKLLDKMERVERPETLPDSVRLRFDKSGESGNDVLYLRNVARGYLNKPLFRDVTLTVKKQERVFITGPNGCGKSTLIKLLAKKDRPDAGEVEYGYNVTVGYYDQENQQLDDSKTVLDELWDAYPDLSQTQLRSALALFLFIGDDVGKQVSTLSGGERARLTLTKLILSKMNLLILDEPTNHLDINSREALEGALGEFEGTIIAVSHDRYFINKLATRVLDFGVPEPLHIYDYHGGWEEYREYKAKYLKPADSERDELVTRAKEDFLSAKQKQSEQRKYERRVRLNAEETESVEKRLGEIASEINGDAAADHIRLAELYNEQQKLEARLLELYEESECLTANPPTV